MNKQGQLGIGTFLMTFIAIITCLALLNGGIYSNIGTMTDKVVKTNQTFTFPTNTTTITLLGQAVESVTVVNGSNGVAINSGNYTITNRVVSNGQLIATLGGTSSIPNSVFAGQQVNITYTYEPFGYATDAGSRSMIDLIAIFAALAVVVIAMMPILREKIFDIF